MAYRSYARKVIRRPVVARKRMVLRRRQSRMRLPRPVRRIIPRPELKRVEFSNANLLQFIGQINVNASNYFCQDFTPSVSSGAGVTARTGSQILLKSSLFRFQFVTQSANLVPIRLRIEFFHVLGSPQSTSSLIPQQLYTANPFIYAGGVNAGIIDYTSQRNQDYMNQYRLIRRTLVTIPLKNYSGAASVKTVSIPVRYNYGRGHTVRFNGNTDTIAGGQIVCFITADAGNSGSASTLSGVATTVASSALTFNFDFKHFYYDD